MYTLLLWLESFQTFLYGLWWAQQSSKEKTLSSQNVNTEYRIHLKMYKDIKVYFLLVNYEAYLFLLVFQADQGFLGTLACLEILAHPVALEPLADLVPQEVLQ